MKKINESFTCIHCQKQIQPALKTCRNHCPHCFASLHVDGAIPGDRNTSCKGTMYPFEYEIRNGKTKIHFKCISCNKLHWNKMADDDNAVAIDSYIQQYKKIFLVADHS
jgi:hypothetical protein